MEILQPGTEVTFKNSNMSGTIRSVTISLNDSITYNIGWWAGDNYNINLFMPEEVEAKLQLPAKQIGFKKE